MQKEVLYIHGKGGDVAECEHYKPLFPDRDVIGLDYRPSHRGKRERKYVLPPKS